VISMIQVEAHIRKRVDWFWCHGPLRETWYLSANNQW